MVHAAVAIRVAGPLFRGAGSKPDRGDPAAAVRLTPVGNEGPVEGSASECLVPILGIGWPLR
jgi:hypothetical protein